MSSKSDRDNRSNQLNSNNSAYHSSRSTLHDQDGDEEINIRFGAVRNYSSFESNRVTRSESYGFGAVSMAKKAVFVTARFHATSDYPVLNPDRNCRYLIDLYVEEFESLARFYLKKLLRVEDLAIFTVFDPSSDRLRWHAPFFPEDVGATRKGLDLTTCAKLAPQIREFLLALNKKEKLQMWPSSLLRRQNSVEVKQQLDPAPFLKALRSAIIFPADSMGEFQVPYNGRMSLANQSDILNLWKKLSSQNAAS
jgi:hypothetical protein